MERTRGGQARLSPYLGRAAGAFAGMAGGLYGLAAGLLIGSMLDQARAKGRLGAYFRDPSAPPLPEALPGLAAAAALALRGLWRGAEDAGRRRALFARLAEKRLGLGAAAKSELARILDAVLAESELELGLLARRLALEGRPEARALLADYAYALLRLGGLRLNHELEFALRAMAADAGLGSRELGEARAYHFPAYRNPWELLGLEPGATASERKSAYRRLSKLRHPDARQGKAESGGEELFRELKEAYEFLGSSSLPAG